MKISPLIILTLLMQMHVTAVAASPAVEEMLQNFRAQGVTQFNATTGRQFWEQAFTRKNGSEVRRCSSCHTTNLRQNGKHIKTGKMIEPLAPSVNAKRLTEVKEIRKWLKRNCTWTLGRECTAQEQGDVLMYLQNL